MERKGEPTARGSGSTTSRQAIMSPWRSRPTSASVSTTAPRDTLTNTAPGLSNRTCSLPIMPRVADVSGTKLTTTSERAMTFSSEVSSRLKIGAQFGRGPRVTYEQRYAEGLKQADQALTSCPGPYEPDGLALQLPVQVTGVAAKYLSVRP